MAGRRGGDETPRAPGWYPDPWSATGEGERYFDGKRWGTTDRPLARHDDGTIDLDAARGRRAKRSRRRRAAGRKHRMRSYAPAVVFVVLAAGIFAAQRGGGSHDNNVTREDRPPAGTEEASHPLGIPPAPPPGDGGYEVLLSQATNEKLPIAWDPCRPIHYVVNHNGEPPDGSTLVRDALARAAAATGFTFVDDGPTTEAPSKARAPYQPTLYDKRRWAPVLIAWSDEVAYPSLAGYIVGLGSANPVPDKTGRLVYVSGQVVLDGRDLAPGVMADRAVARAAVMHELGHLLGLDHTADRQQLMFSEAEYNVREYGPGDRRGLAVLASQPCAPSL